MEKTVEEGLENRGLRMWEQLARWRGYSEMKSITWEEYDSGSDNKSTLTGLEVKE